MARRTISNGVVDYVLSDPSSVLAQLPVYPVINLSVQVVPLHRPAICAQSGPLRHSQIDIVSLSLSGLTCTYGKDHFALSILPWLTLLALV